MKENQTSFTMKRNIWGSFSIIGLIIFGLLLPAILLTHVFVDYATYVSGYATYAKATLEQDIVTTQAYVDEANKQVSTANQTIAANQTTIEEINAQISSLEGEIEAKTAAKDACSTKIAESSAALESLKNEISELTSQKAALESSKQLLLANLEVLTQDLSSTNNQLQNAQKDVKDAEIALLQAKKSVLEQKLNGLDKYEVDAKEALDAKISTLNEEIELLEAEIAALESQHDENTKQSKSLEEEMKPNQTAIKDVQAELDKLNITIGKYETFIADSEEKIAAAQQSIDDITKQITETKPSIGDLAISLTDVELEIKKLEDKKSQLDPATEAEAIASIDEKLTALETCLTELQAQYETAYQTRKAQETEISDYQKIIKEETLKKEKNLAIIQENVEKVVTPLNEKKAHLEKIVADYQQQIDDLVNANTLLLEEIETKTVSIEEKQAEILSCETLINGLPIDDTSAIENLETEIAAIDEQIAKWESGELQPNTEPVAPYTGEAFTVKEQQQKQTVETLIVKKNVLSEKISAKETCEETLTAKNAEFADNERLLQENQDAISAKENEFADTETVLNTEKENEASITQEISNLKKDVSTKKNSKEELTSKNATLQEEIKMHETTINIHTDRLNVLNEILNTQGSALLHSEEVTLIAAFETDALSEEKPYQAKAEDSGLLTTTKLLFETLGLNMKQVKIATYAFAVISILILVGAPLIVINRIRKTRRTKYVVAENVIQHYISNNIPALQFILEYGATVQVKQSLKGRLFGYGTLIISQGTGFAGKCTLQKIQSVHKMKRLLQKQINLYGLCGQPTQTTYYYPQAL